MTRKRTHVAVAVVGALVAAGCGSPESRPVPDEEIARAQAVLTPMKKQLMGALTAALADGDPVQAIQVCRVQAPAIEQAVAGEDMELGRTSHRLRNPANAPRAWVKPLLAEYVSGAGDAGPRAIRLPNGRIGYVEPIRAKAMCLECHGANIAPPIAALVGELYPEDAATGFAEGDFRGLFWVELVPRPDTAKS